MYYEETPSLLERCLLDVQSDVSEFRSFQSVITISNVISEDSAKDNVELKHAICKAFNFRVIKKILVFLETADSDHNNSHFKCAAYKIFRFLCDGSMFAENAFLVEVSNHLMKTLTASSTANQDMCVYLNHAVRCLSAMASHSPRARKILLDGGLLHVYEALIKENRIYGTMIASILFLISDENESIPNPRHALLLIDILEVFLDSIRKEDGRVTDTVLFYELLVSVTFFSGDHEALTRPTKMKLYYTILEFTKQVASFGDCADFAMKARYFDYLGRFLDMPNIFYDAVKCTIEIVRNSTQDVWVTHHAVLFQVIDRVASDLAKESNCNIFEKCFDLLGLLHVRSSEHFDEHFKEHKAIASNIEQIVKRMMKKDVMTMNDDDADADDHEESRYCCYELLSIILKYFGNECFETSENENTDFAFNVILSTCGQLEFFVENILANRMDFKAVKFEVLYKILLAVLRSDIHGRSEKTTVRSCWKKPLFICFKTVNKMLFKKTKFAMENGEFFELFAKLCHLECVWLLIQSVGFAEKIHYLRKLMQLTVYLYGNMCDEEYRQRITGNVVNVLYRLSSEQYGVEISGLCKAMDFQVVLGPYIADVSALVFHSEFTDFMPDLETACLLLTTTIMDDSSAAMSSAFKGIPQQLTMLLSHPELDYRTYRFKTSLSIVALEILYKNDSFQIKNRSDFSLFQNALTTLLQTILNATEEVGLTVEDKLICGVPTAESYFKSAMDYLRSSVDYDPFIADYILQSGWTDQLVEDLCTVEGFRVPIHVLTAVETVFIELTKLPVFGVQFYTLFKNVGLPYICEIHSFTDLKNILSQSHDTQNYLAQDVTQAQIAEENGPHEVSQEVSQVVS